MIYYRKRSALSIAEVWYDVSQFPQGKADVIKYKFVQKAVNKTARVEELYTLLIDLNEEEDVLFSRIGKNTCYKINRARKRDNIECLTFFGQGEKERGKIDQYIGYFNQFTAAKKRTPIAFSDLEQFYDKSTLCIRAACGGGDKSAIYAMHAYIISDNRARLHQSSSHYRNSEDSEWRNRIGRANRFLHWDDMLYFKTMGLEYYDFGGWYGGNTDKEKLAINGFKEAFGGTKEREYSYTVPVSPLGSIAVFAQGILKKTKK
jgi:lipid II:glycine glycyltransferase (peptidoglycan interpeptide bridge formation enzyme)